MELRCPTCKSNLQQGANHCSHCGAAIPWRNNPDLEREHARLVSQLTLMPKCPKCGTLLEQGDQFCGQCGARVDASAGAPASALPRRAVQSSLAQGLASATEAASPDWVAIGIALALEVMGTVTNFGNNKITFVGGMMWLIATVMGFFLLASRNKVNKAVGIITTILMLVWIACIVLPREPDKVSGTYHSQLGIASVVFSPNGTFTYEPTGGQPMSGTYEIDGNTLRLDLTSGQLAQSGMANSPMGQMLTSAYTAQVSDDHNSFVLFGTEFVKAQSQE